MEIAAVGSGSARRMSEIAQLAKSKPSLLDDFSSIGWRPYRRLYGYAMPYKWRFVLGPGFRLSVRRYHLLSCRSSWRR